MNDSVAPTTQPRGSDDLRGSSFGSVAPPVIIVDDSPTTREMLRTILEVCGQAPAAIYEAGDGIDAVKCLKKYIIGLMLVDLHMPRMDGFQLVEWISRQPDYRSVKIAVITAEDCQKYAKVWIRYGIRSTIRKPFRPEQIRDVYRNLVTNYRLGVAP
jgi:CheY-like chemotaxis protein